MYQHFFSGHSFCRPSVRHLFMLGLLLCCTIFLPTNIHGQVVRTVPTSEYFAIGLVYYNRGEFRKAQTEFNSYLRSAVKMPNSRGQIDLWLDSMCYWTMIGETHYQLAEYDLAMTAFDNALAIYLQQPTWLNNLIYARDPTAVPRVPLVWGASERKGGVGEFRQSDFQIRQDLIDLVPLKQQGVAVVQNSKLVTIRADEIIAKMALMIRRRAEILGPLSKYDPTTKTLTEILGGRPCPPNHFSGSWIDVLYGLSLSAMGDDAAAEPILLRGLLMIGTFDHQLTAVALNELGNIAMRNGKNEDAMKCYAEASYSAFIFQDWALLGEVFRNMGNLQKWIDKTKPLPLLQLALNWFSNQRDVCPLVLLPLLHEVAEDKFMQQAVTEAEILRTRAANLMNRTVLTETMHWARNQYLAAMISYSIATKNFVDGKPFSLLPGDQFLVSALKMLRRGSLWIYQIRYLEQLFAKGAISTRGAITMRAADELFDIMLREPTAFDWSVRPMESLAVMTLVPPAIYERWFFVAMQRGDREKAFNITERSRQARFYAAFDLGPRLFSLRSLLEPGEDETEAGKLAARQEIVTLFPAFEELNKRIANTKNNLQTVPLFSNEKSSSKEPSKLALLEKDSIAQEALLRQVALARISVPNSFPPMLTLEEIRKQLPEKTSMLVFVDSLGTTYGFLIDQKSFEMWPIIQDTRAPSIQKLVVDFLEGMGNRDANRAMTEKELLDSKAKWKTAGSELLKRLLNKEKEVAFTELVIVPTGILWYVPFEALTIPVDGDYLPVLTAAEDPLIIRYAPTASLGVPLKQGRSATMQTLVFTGKMSSKDEPQVAKDAVDRYKKSGVKNLVTISTIPRESDFREIPCSPSTFAARLKQLVVLDDIPVARDLPFNWSPFTGERGKTESIASWLQLPWGGPQLVVLPGFHTPAESALKTSKNATIIPNGDDIFLSAMILEGCGARTILLSRWKTGGRASYDLVGEFLRNYTKMPAAAAWRESILSVAGNELKQDEEPRLKVSDTSEPLLANHPFFWSNFLLIDRGEIPDAKITSLGSDISIDEIMDQTPENTNE
ncbi:MAG: hypothetical protein ACRCUY_04525 [Thermoguttaceae bacterium]